jgi:hypothetical protein
MQGLDALEGEKTTFKGRLSRISGAMEGEFDHIFAHIAERSGGLQMFFHHMFGFLKRRTDFYMTFASSDKQARAGFPPGVAEKLILRAMKEYPFDREPMLPEVPLASSQGTATKQGIPDAPPAVGNETILSSGVQKMSVTSRSTNLSKLPPSPANSVSETEPKVARHPKIEFTKEGKMVPVGNGGIEDTYYWTQTLKEVTMFIEAPGGIAGKEVQCEIGASTVRLSARGHKLLEGMLGGVVHPSESMWTLQSDSSIRVSVDGSGSASSSSSSSSNSSSSSSSRNTGNGDPTSSERSVVIISLDKAKDVWWSSAVQGHREIDCNKVLYIALMPLFISFTRFQVILACAS